LHRRFGWQVGKHFNMAEVCVRRWATQDAGQPQALQRTAIIEHRPGQRPGCWSYVQLQSQANALSRVLRGLGVKRGDRVAIVLPQRFETAVAYMAVLQMGAVAWVLLQIPDEKWVVWGAGIATLLSGLGYIWRGMQSMGGAAKAE
jgi:acetyl-CoA synthetase